MIRLAGDAAIREHGITLGDSRIGIDFNPSGSKTIAEIKRRAADLIDAVDAIELPGEAPGEIARLKALAMTEIESAVMWAVMAAARSEAASRLPGVAAARIVTTLRSFCEAVGWPRLRRLSDAIARVRESERRAAAAPKPAPAPGPALTADPQGEIHLAVTWQQEIDDSGGKYPPAESGGGWLYGTSDDPRLAITLAWTEAKFDRSMREKYEVLHFAAAIGKVEGKTLFVNGRCISPVSSKRRRFSGELKAKVALEALRSDWTLQEIASQHQVHPNQVGAWKRQAIEGLVEVFSKGAERRVRDHESEVRDLHAKIGELIVERDFLSRGPGR